jgi:hypothetical protein
MSKGAIIGRLTSKHAIAKCIAHGQTVLHASIYAIGKRSSENMTVISLKVVTGPRGTHWTEPGAIVERRHMVRLVNEKDYQASLSRCFHMERIHFWHEPDNPHDSRAIAATNSNGELIGYVRGESWLHIALLDEQRRYTAEVSWIERGMAGLLTCGLEISLDGDPIGIREFVASPSSPLRYFYGDAERRSCVAVNDGNATSDVQHAVGGNSPPVVPARAFVVLAILCLLLISAVMYLAL